MEFNEYFKEFKESEILLNNCYKGISKKDFSKWKGWDIIKSYRIKGFHIKDIEDPCLDILVRNFYYCKWMEEYLDI